MSALKLSIRLCSVLLISVGGALAEDDAEPLPDEQPEQDEQAQPPRAGIVSYGPAHLDDEMEARFPGETRWLETERERFLVLQRRQETPARRGGVVLIADAGRSPSVGLLAGLRDALPRAGWYSIALTLPETPLEPVPERVVPEQAEPIDEDEQAEEAAADVAEENGEPEGGMTIDVLRGDAGDQAFRDDYRKAALNRVDAAVAELRNQGIENIVLAGVGEGADVATRYMLANQPVFMPGGLGLIWINGRFSAPLDGDLQEALGDGFGIPVLDIYDRHRHGERAGARKVAAQRGAFEQYRQAAMPLQRETGKAVQRRVAARVTGWLENNMVGVERERNDD